MLKKTKIALATASLATVAAGVAIGVPVALTANTSTAIQNNSTGSVAPASPATNATTPATTPNTNASAAETTTSAGKVYIDAANLDAAVTALKSTTSSSLTKTAFQKLAIDTPETLNPSKLGLPSIAALSDVTVKVSKLSLYDKQFVRYTVTAGTKAVNFRVEFSRFSGDNTALLALLPSVKETGFTESAFEQLAINSQPFNLFALKIAVPSSLDSAAVLVDKTAGSKTVTFLSVVGSQTVSVAFSKFASAVPAERVAAAKTAIESLKSSALSLYMLGQAYAKDAKFDGSLIGTMTPAVVQAVNLSFSKAYGQTGFTYSINEAGTPSVNGSVAISNYSQDTSAEQVLVDYLTNKFKAVSSSTFSEEAFKALSLPTGTPWNAATLGVLFTSTLEMEQRTLPGNPAATYAQPLLAVSSWQDFPFLPHVSISKSAGSKVVDVRFTLGTSDLDQYNFVTQFAIEINTFGSDAAKQNIEALSKVLSDATVSNMDADGFLGTSVNDYLPFAALRIGLPLSDTSPAADFLAPLATNGIQVKAVKTANSNAVSYELAYAGEVGNTSTVFTGVAPTKKEIALGKAITALKSARASSLLQSDFMDETVSSQSLPFSSLGVSSPALADGLTVTATKARGSAVVTYTVSLEGTSVSFDVAFNSYAPETAASTKTFEEAVLETKLAINNITATSFSEANFKALSVPAGTPLEDANLGISFPKQVLDLKPTVSKAPNGDLFLTLSKDGKWTEIAVPLTIYNLNPNPSLKAAEQAVLLSTSTTFTKEAFLNLYFNFERDYDALSLASALGIGGILNLNNTTVRIKKDVGSATVQYRFYYVGYRVDNQATFTSFNPANISASDQAVLTALSQIRSTSYSFPAFGLQEIDPGTPFNVEDTGFDLPAIAKGHNITVSKQREGDAKLASFTMKLTVEDIPGKPSVNINLWDFSSSKAVAPTILGAQYLPTVLTLATLNRTSFSAESFKKLSFSNVPFNANAAGLLGNVAVAAGSTIKMSKATGTTTIAYQITAADGNKGSFTANFTSFPDAGEEAYYVQQNLLALYKSSLDARALYAVVLPAGISTLSAFAKLGIKFPEQIDLSRFKIEVKKVAKTTWLDFTVTPIYSGATVKPFRAIAWIALDKQGV